MKAQYIIAPVRVELADAYPELGQVRDAVSRADWQALTSYFDDLPPGADAGEAVTVAARVASGFLQQMHFQDPASPLARVLFAARLIESGWQRRGNRLARQVSPTAFAAFHDFLEQAEDLLAGIGSVPTLDAAVWELRMVTARGLQMGHQEAWARYQAARAVIANPLGVQIQMAQQLCPKWGGTFEQLHWFTAQCVREAPEGALQGALVAEGFLEHFLELDNSRAFLRRPDVKQAIDDAARRSVLHSDCRIGRRWVWAHSCFAMAYRMMWRGRDARPHFAALQDRSGRWPWEVFGGAASTYRLNYLVTYLGGGWRG